MKLSVIFLSFCVLITLCASQYLEEKPRKCNIEYRCSDLEEPVWTTTNNKSCELFRNSCLKISENCNRRNNDEPEARDIGQEKCQKLCRKQKCCKNINNTPICGYYNGILHNFGSPCEMSKHICTTGQTYSLYSEGVCPLAVPA